MDAGRLSWMALALKNLPAPDPSPSPMTAATDADRCAREAIHLPGTIQPHGVLLVLDPVDLTVLQASANAAERLGWAPTPGHPLPAGHALSDGLTRAFREGDPTLHWLSARIHQPPHCWNIHARRGAQGWVVDLEATETSDLGLQDALYPGIRAFVDRIETTREVRELCEVAALEVRRLTGFHRVMVYRFSPEWSGTVVAEDGDGTLPSYLDLRFPASDIPAQARALYLRTRLRLIPDATYTPVPVLPALSPLDGLPLDLSDSALRSVSPVHLEYMRNMGTAASMSISILVDGQLWGLISCHHASPLVLGPQIRSSCDFIGQLLAMQIDARERGAHADERLGLKDVEAELLARVSWSSTVQSGLSETPDAWLALTRATGAAIVKDGEVATAGRTPDAALLNRLVDWVRARAGGEMFATDRLGEHFPEMAAHADLACGLLAVPVSALHAHYILWFRPEMVHTVRWGGAPTKVEAPDGSLHPRQSFAQWAEEVRGRAVPWTRAEIEAADSFRHSVVNFVLRRAEERAQLTEKLETTNRELEAFSYSVSHDLRAPFRHVVGYAQLLRERRDQLDERSLHYLDSIIASALSAGELVDDLLNFSQLGRASLDLTRVDVDKMVFELQRSMEMEAAGRPIKWVVHRLPPAVADAALLRQALANLLDNAVKYTRGRDPAVIEISGEERAHEVVYAVRDNGVGFDMAYVGKLFGVFQRLHRVEEFEGTGIGLALVRRIVDRHGGWIAAEGELDQGAVFRVGLPKPEKEQVQ